MDEVIGENDIETFNSIPEVYHYFDENREPGTKAVLEAHNLKEASALAYMIKRQAKSWGMTLSIEKKLTRVIVTLEAIEEKEDSTSPINRLAGWVRGSVKNLKEGRRHKG